MSDVDLKEILTKAFVVIEYRNGDIGTEDGSFATTDTDAMIGLEMALSEAFNDDGDDATFLECWSNVKEYCDEIKRLSAKVAELEELQKETLQACSDILTGKFEPFKFNDSNRPSLSESMDQYVEDSLAEKESLRRHNDALESKLSELQLAKDFYKHSDELARFKIKMLQRENASLNIKLGNEKGSIYLCNDHGGVGFKSDCSMCLLVAKGG